MGELEGKLAVVTGAGRGLGRIEALELARLGARVVINDLGVAADGSGVMNRRARLSWTRSRRWRRDCHPFG